YSGGITSSEFLYFLSGGGGGASFSLFIQHLIVSSLIRPSYRRDSFAIIFVLDSAGSFFHVAFMMATISSCKWWRGPEAASLLLLLITPSDINLITLPPPFEAIQALLYTHERSSAVFLYPSSSSIKMDFRNTLAL